MQDIVGEVIRRVKEEKMILDATLASGTNVHNFEQYQRLVGKGEGLSRALLLIDEILTEDDEAE
jgi:aromatic ring-opening dioxygenase catalytic subunit (LigB family)